MKIIIATEPDDYHAAAVKLALEQRGSECILWFTADMPSMQTNSIDFNDSSYNWNSEDKFSSELLSSDFDTIWWRRPRRPFIKRAVPQDKLFVKKENYIFFDSFPWLFRENTRWINPIEVQEKANSKLFQLKLAQKHGFLIPPTLASNSPEKIKAFIRSYTKEGVIYKTFAPHSWCENDLLKLPYTTKVSIQELPSDEILQLTPGIFQKCIKKSYELRITYFGSKIYAVKINSQEHVQGSLDWRIIPTEDLSLEPYKLPVNLEQKIREYMQELGIVFGCFDFIVTPTKEYYFLEVNQQGQFLWIEDCLPESALLDKFILFLLAGSDNYEWQKPQIYLPDIEDETLKLINSNMQKHIWLNQIKNFSTAA